jgi:hypothetical protein
MSLYSTHTALRSKCVCKAQTYVVGAAASHAVADLLQQSVELKIGILLVLLSAHPQRGRVDATRSEESLGTQIGPLKRKHVLDKVMVITDLTSVT